MGCPLHFPNLQLRAWWRHCMINVASHRSWCWTSDTRMFFFLSTTSISLPYREGSLHCSLELCYLWLSAVSGQLVLGLQIHSRKAEVAAREVTAGLLIHSDGQKYLSASSCLCFCSLRKCVGGFAAIWILSDPLWEQQQQQLSLLLMKHHGHSTPALTVPGLSEKPRTPSHSWPWVSMCTSLDENATSRLQPSLKSGAFCLLLLGPSGSNWKSVCQ